MNELTTDLKSLHEETLSNLKSSKANNTLRAYKSDFKEREYEQFVWYWKRKSTGDIYRGRTRAELFRIRNDLLTPPPFKKPKAMGIFAKRWKKLNCPQKIIKK